MNLRLPHSDPDHPSLVRRMLASPGRTLVPVALSLAIITILLFAMISRGPSIAQANAGDEIEPSDVRGAMIRLGLDAESLAAAGVSSEEAGPMVTAVAARLEAMEPSLATLDANIAAARGEISRLTRAVHSGTGSNEDAAALTSAQSTLATAEAARSTALATVFDAATASLDEGEIATLQTMAANSRWDVGTAFKAVDRTDDDWVALRRALAYERVAAENPDAEENSTATTLLATARSHADVAAAQANIQVSLTSVSSACETAIANLTVGE